MLIFIHSYLSVQEDTQTDQLDYYLIKIIIYYYTWSDLKKKDYFVQDQGFSQNTLTRKKCGKTPHLLNNH